MVKSRGVDATYQERLEVVFRLVILKLPKKQIAKTMLSSLDRTIHHKWKNAKNGGLYAIWNSRFPSRRTTGGFFNDVRSSWAAIPQSLFQNEIEG